MRKNLSHRRMSGHRGDWILRLTENGEHIEYGIGEADRSWIDEHGTKFLRETCIKCPKCLKDMLIKLMKAVRWEKELCKQLQTVGIIHAGMMMMTVILDNPCGYVCRIRRGDIMQVPDVEGNFSDIIPILAAVLNIKAVVKGTVKTVQAKPAQSKERMTEMPVQAGIQRRPQDTYAISPCMSTPKKAKIEAEPPTKHRLRLNKDREKKKVHATSQ